MTNDNLDKTTAGVSRRGFLAGSGVLAVGAVAVACGKKSSSTTKDTTKDTTGGGSSKVDPGDAKTAKLAASLEVLAVATYKAALDAATGNKIGEVSPAVATYVKTAMDHHQQALDAWNSVLTGAGAEEVTAPPADLKATVDGEFAKVKDQIGAAKLALLLETVAADTYLAALPTLKSKDAILLAGQLQSVDQEHAAILHFVLGEYPVPDFFQKTEKAYAGTG